MEDEAASGAMSEELKEAVKEKLKELHEEATQKEDMGLDPARDSVEVEEQRNILNFGPHPLGGLQVLLIGSDGSRAIGRISMEQAVMANAHLGALVTMWFEGLYAKAAAEAEDAIRSAQNLYTPPGAKR